MDQQDRAKASDVRQAELIAQWQLHAARQEQQGEDSQASQLRVSSMRTVFRRTAVRTLRVGLTAAFKQWVSVVMELFHSRESMLLRRGVPNVATQKKVGVAVLD